MNAQFWQGLGRVGRIGVVVGIAVIAAITVLVAYWTLRTDYQVLFADLTPHDAAAMTAELESQKIPFTVVEEDPGDGTTILVDKKDVYRTRIKMMGGNIPLRGAVGFELFDNSDFGMTEFAQKVNYQRALQGELIRTILSLSEVRDVRVLLALPEQGLFRQATTKAKASITLALRQGQVLRPEQVTGVQRLVAAAVPGIAAEDVTIVDQWGVALTRVAGDEHAEGGSSHLLDLKKDAENYLSRKATDVLERTLGPGQGIASVDVTLNLDRIQTTVHDVVAAPGKPGQLQTGVVVRERQTVRDLGGPFSVRTADGESGAVGGSSQREVEYAVGSRVEQVVSQPGSIRRIHAVAVVKRALDARQQEQIVSLVSASVGASADRGDTVVVQSIEAMNSRIDASAATRQELAEEDAARPAAASPGGSEQGREVPSGARATDPALTIAAKGLGLAMAIVVAAGLWLLWRVRRQAPGGRAPSSAPPTLSETEREAALAQLKAWLNGAGERRAQGEST
jgi:flagellar M-ring protein FliF